MKFKSLLLGTAASLAFAGGNAMAADLSIAEPVDYVRVCDAFGAGFWYLPQTDSCFAIGGEVAVGVNFNTGGSHSWDTFIETEVTTTFSKMTDYGPLTAFMKWASDGPGYDWYNKEAFISLGNTSFGYYDSVARTGVGFSDSKYKINNVTTMQVSHVFDLNGATLAVGIQDPYYDSIGGYSNDSPEIAISLEGSAGGVDLFGGAILALDPTCGDSAYSVGGKASTSVDMLDFVIGGEISNCGGGDADTVFGGGLKLNLTDDFQVAGDAFIDEDDYWWGAVTAYYSVTSGLDFMLNAEFNDVDGFDGATAKFTAAMP